MPVYRLDERLWFPDPRVSHSSGLLAVGGDLGLERLILAYTHGIFPWYSEGEEILWWSPDPRFVMEPQDFRKSRSLRQTLKNGVSRSYAGVCQAGATRSGWDLDYVRYVRCLSAPISGGTGPFCGGFSKSTSGGWLVRDLPGAVLFWGEYVSSRKQCVESRFGSPCVSLSRCGIDRLSGAHSVFRIHGGALYPTRDVSDLFGGPRACTQSLAGDEIEAFRSVLIGRLKDASRPPSESLRKDVLRKANLDVVCQGGIFLWRSRNDRIN